MPIAARMPARYDAAVRRIRAPHGAVPGVKVPADAGSAKKALRAAS